MNVICEGQLRHLFLILAEPFLKDSHAIVHDEVSRQSCAKYDKRSHQVDAPRFELGAPRSFGEP